MIDYILLFTIVALLVKSYVDERDNKAERTRLIKALMAKNLQDYTANEIIDKEPKETPLPEEIPAEQAEPSLFEKHLETLINNATGQTEH